MIHGGVQCQCWLKWHLVVNRPFAITKNMFASVSNPAPWIQGSLLVISPKIKRNVCSSGHLQPKFSTWSFAEDCISSSPNSEGVIGRHLRETVFCISACRHDVLSENLNVARHVLPHEQTLISSLKIKSKEADTVRLCVSVCVSAYLRLSPSLSAFLSCGVCVGVSVCLPLSQPCLALFLSVSVLTHQEKIPIKENMNWIRSRDITQTAYSLKSRRVTIPVVEECGIFAGVGRAPRLLVISDGCYRHNAKGLEWSTLSNTSVAGWRTVS